MLIAVLLSAGALPASWLLAQRENCLLGCLDWTLPEDVTTVTKWIFYYGNQKLWLCPNCVKSCTHRQVRLYDADVAFE
jgi:hypothetical protein